MGLGSLHLRTELTPELSLKEYSRTQNRLISTFKNLDGRGVKIIQRESICT